VSALDGANADLLGGDADGGELQLLVVVNHL
jgi:hypothetical protein